MLNFSAICHSQTYQVFDASTKQPVSYVAVIIGNNSGFYSDKHGVFKIPKNKQGNIILRSMGYKDLPVTQEDLKDSIYLTPKTHQLKKVVIHTKQPKLKTIGKKEQNINWHIKHSLMQLGSLLKPSEKYIGSYIRKVFIPIDKSTIVNKDEQPKNIKPDFKSVFKVHLFSNKNNLPAKPLLLKPITVYCNQDSKNPVEIDLSEKNIVFPEKGIFICVEMVGEIDENGSVIDKPYSLPGFCFTKKNSRHFKSKTYYKTKRSNKWKFMDPEEFNLPKEIFFAFQLELATYKR